MVPVEIALIGAPASGGNSPTSSHGVQLLATIVSILSILTLPAGDAAWRSAKCKRAGPFLAICSPFWLKLRS
jgi:hypothetical protein